MFDEKNNSVGFLRLALALLVIFSHTFIYNVARDPLEVFSHDRLSFGSFAVNGFFLLSGVLITASYLRTDNLPRYAWHRCLRILPGLWVCLLAISLGLPLLFHRPPDWNYFLNNWWLVLRLEAERSWAMPFEHIPGVFSGGMLDGQINGVTWTLGHEFRCYILLGLLGALGVLKQQRWVIPVCFLVLWGLDLWHLQAFAYESKTLRVMMFFFLGAACYLYREGLPRSWGFAAVAAVLAPLSLHFGGYIWIAPFVTACLVFFLADAVPIRRWPRSDYSYGFYIYAAPVQHCLNTWGAWSLGWLPFFALSALFTLPLAYLSWHLVEQPALRLKHLKIDGMVAQGAGRS